MTRSRVVFYHGTRAGFRGSGGLVLPRVQTGRPANHEAASAGPSFAPDAGEWVYVTLDLELAWDFAEAAQGRGKPKVLVVAPWSTPVEDWSSVNGEVLPMYRVEGATVEKVLTAR